MRFKYAVDLSSWNWSQFHWKAGLRRVPAIVVLLLVGIFCRQIGAGVLAAAAAFSVGLGAFRQVRGSRFLAMICTMFLMAFSALIGTLAGTFYPVLILMTVLWGLACGLFNVLNEDVGWITMQGVIALLVATAFPSHGVYAIGRAESILVGGLAQMLVLLLIWCLEGISRFGDEFASPEAFHKIAPNPPALWKSFRESLFFSSVAFRYAIRVAITLVIAVEMDHLLKLKNGYWLPMTTLIVLKPDFYRTYTGGVQRVMGTLVGVIVASLIALVLRPQNLVLVVLVGFFGFFTYAFQKVNAVVFSTVLTAFVVFLIAVTGLPEASVTWHRLINTFLGCVLAMTSRFIVFYILHPIYPQPSVKDLSH